MKKLLNFIQKEPIDESSIFPYLKCSPKQALILRYLCLELLKGNDEIICLDCINALFCPKDYEVLDHLNDFKNLLELGWITQNHLLKNHHDIILLELINLSISLSQNFLKLLEETEPKLPKSTPYHNHLEYLKDQFSYIQMLWGLIPLKKDNKPSPLLNKNLQKIKEFQERITERISITKQDLPLEELFKEYNLNLQEKIIFLALLKEEYSGKESDGRDLNSLIWLISANDYDRIKNRSLLDDRSTLVQKGLIDYDEILSSFGGICRTFFIPDAILKKITHPTNNKKEKIKLENLIKEQELFEYIKPKQTLSQVVLNTHTKQTLETLLQQVNNHVLQKLKLWGIKDKKRGIDAKIIFYGPAGTGKTLTAMAFANSLKKPLLSFDCSKILSMYVGESEKNVRRIFDAYQELTNQSKTHPILLLNEADQFLSTRTQNIASSSEKMHNQMQNIFLEQIEKFEGILIATTNLLETIDTAFSRRFNYKIEFKKPNKQERLLLWQKLLPKNAPFSQDFDIEPLANFELTGGQIALIIKNTAYKIACQSHCIFTTACFVDEIKKELKGNFDSQREMGFAH